MLWNICRNPKRNFNLCSHKHRLSHWKQPKKLASLLTTYNLSHKFNFAKRIQNNSSNAIDNIFVDNSIINLSYISSIIKCLSGHDAQILKTKCVCVYIYIYICNNNQTSIEAENQINKQINNHELSGSTKKTWELL